MMEYWLFITLIAIVVMRLLYELYIAHSKRRLQKKVSDIYRDINDRKY